MRHLAIGDIHGCFQALRTLEKCVPFRADDEIVLLGDYVDRGPETCAVLDWLVIRARTHKLVALRGNHEIMMLNAHAGKDMLRSWLSCGGKQTLASYSPFEDGGKLADVPDDHWRFLDKQLRPYHEIDSHFFVHANAFPEMPLAEQPDLMLYWEKLHEPPPHESGKVMVCGHTPQKSGLPLSLGHAVCLDTLAYGGGWLTCLDVKTGQYWQANQKGEHRSDYLDSAS